MPYEIKVQHSAQFLVQSERSAVQGRPSFPWILLDPLTGVEAAFPTGQNVLIAPSNERTKCLEPKAMTDRSAIILSPIRLSKKSQQWRFLLVEEVHRAIDEVPDAGHQSWFFIVNRVPRQEGTRPHWVMDVQIASLKSGVPVILYHVKKPHGKCSGNQWWKPIAIE